MKGWMVSLGTKLGLIVSFAGVAMFGLYAGVQQYVILPGVLRTEEQEARESMDRCVNSLRREIHHLETLTRDWAAWDDTYRYVVEPNADYDESNLTLTSFSDNNICAIFILGTDGAVVWGRAYDLDGDTPESIRLFPEERWALTNPLMEQPLTGVLVSGLLVTEHGPILVSSQPILNSMNEGPVRGVFVMARPLDETMAKELEQETLLPISIVTADEWGLTPSDRRAVEFLERDGKYYFDRANDEVMYAYALFNSIGGKPGVLMRVEVKRDVLGVGRAAMRLALQALGVSVVLVIVFLAFLLRRTVTAPLSRLTGHISQQGESGRLETLPLQGRRDEIGVLEREYNFLVRRLQHERAVRQEAEAEVLEREAHLRAIVEHAPDAILTIAPEGLVRSANPAAGKMFGCAEAELEGRRIEEFVSPPPGPAGTAGASSAMQGTRRDGTRFPVDVATSDVFLEEEGLFAVIIRDVTELHEMQARMVRREQLAVLGEMGATMAHELRNPLAAIGGAIQVIRGDFSETDARRPVMDEVLEQVNRVDGIVRRLLMLSKPWEPVLGACDLRALAENVIRDAGKSGLLDGVRVVFDPEEAAESFVVQADIGLVEQVYRNLLSNSADALGAVEAGAGEVRWAFVRQGGEVRVSMSDTGPGMPPEVMDHLFRPFFTTKTYGTGLGLLICRRIMEAHGGSIEVASAPGEGARITLVFRAESDGAGRAANFHAPDENTQALRGE